MSYRDKEVVGLCAFSCAASIRLRSVNRCCENCKQFNASDIGGLNFWLLKYKVTKEIIYTIDKINAQKAKYQKLKLGC
jgi:hypothetical protein